MASPLPQLVLLYVIHRVKEVTLPELMQVMYMLKNRGVNIGYNFVKLRELAVSRDLQLDVNLLKVLGLVRDLDGGKLSVTEKGKMIVSKLRRNKQYAWVLDVVDKVLEEMLDQMRLRSQS